MKLGLIAVTILVVGLLALARPAQADTAITISSVAASTESNNRWASHASDWSGMSGVFPTGTDCLQAPNNNAWNATNDSTNNWIAWDLGATDTVVSMHVWNYNENNWIHLGISKFDLQVSDGTGNGIPAAFGGTAGWTTVTTGVDWSASADQGTGFDGYTGFDYNNTDVSTRYIRFANIDSIGVSGFGGVGKAGGLSEIIFFTPEPATMALLALGGVGLLLKRRRR